MTSIAEDFYPNNMTSITEDFYPNNMTSITEDLYPNKMTSIAEDLYPNNMTSITEDIYPNPDSVILYADRISIGQKKEYEAIPMNSFGKVLLTQEQSKVFMKVFGE